jgi:hypothetical protein
MQNKVSVTTYRKSANSFKLYSKSQGNRQGGLGYRVFPNGGSQAGVKGSSRDSKLLRNRLPFSRAHMANQSTAMGASCM